MEGRKLKDLELKPPTARERNVHVARVHNIPVKILREPYSISDNSDAGYIHNTARYLDLLRRSGHNLKRRKKYTLPTLILSFAFIAVTPFSMFSTGGKISNIKAEVASYAEEGVESMKAGGESIKRHDFDKAQQNFNNASRNFHSAIAVLNQYGQYNLSLSYEGSTISDASNLLRSAELINDSMLISSTVLSDMYSTLSSIGSGNSEDQSGKFIKYLGDNREIIGSNVKIIDSNLGEAESKINQVNNGDFNKYKQMITNYVPLIRQEITSFKSFVDDSADILGYNESKKILILFLNNAELRPGGGFIGSYATTELVNGNMSKLSIDTNIIKKDHTFGALYNVSAPYPLSLVSKEWYMRDSNWDVNFNESAKNTAWFYKEEGGPNVDMILTIDSTFISNLLSITGPIKLDDGSSLNDQNFNDILTYSIENKYWQSDVNKNSNEPKTIIKEIYPKLLSAIDESIKTDPLKTFRILEQNYQTRHLNLSYTGNINSGLEQKINNANLFTGEDFIMVNNANAGGLKSSLSIEQSVDIDIEPKNNGDLYHRVEIKRIHKGSSIWPDGDNHNFIRIAVPNNAVLERAISNGDEYGITNNDVIIEDAHGYKTFGLWQTTKVGGNSQSIFEYKTPMSSFINKKSYNFNYYKQPGSIGEQLNINIFGNNRFKISQFNTINKYSNTDEFIKYIIRK